jgi:hypothetical protein
MPIQGIRQRAPFMEVYGSEVGIKLGSDITLVDNFENKTTDTERHVKINNDPQVAAIEAKHQAEVAEAAVFKKKGKGG